MINPFLSSHKLALMEIHEEIKTVDTNDIDEGMILKFSKTTKTYCIEQQEKTSVYDIPKIENILYTELTPKSRDLLLFIIYNIKRDEDFINLKLDLLSKKMNVGKTTLIGAIKELQDIALICKKSQSEYWVNPKSKTEYRN